MHFEVLNTNRTGTSKIEMLKSNVIRITRKPTKVFEFKDPNAFVDVLVGSGACIVYVGKDSDDSEQWKAYYWQPTYEQAKKSWGDGESLLPFGSLAVLEMEGEFDLQWTLEERTKKTRRWVDVFNDIRRLCGKISNIDRDSKYADVDRFRFMTIEELETVLKEIKENYKALTQTEEADV